MTPPEDRAQSIIQGDPSKGDMAEMIRMVILTSPLGGIKLLQWLKLAITQAITDAVEEERERHIMPTRVRPPLILEESDSETENLEVCVELAREEEREACAKVAEDRYYALDLQEVRAAVTGIARAIRERK